MKKTTLYFLYPLFRNLFIFLFLGCISAHAQSVTIKGNIVDENTLEPIALASIFIANTTYGTMSDKEGEFSLTFLTSEGLTLIVSHIGYHTKTFKLGVDHNSTKLDIKLQFKEHVLDQLTITNNNDKMRYLNHFREGLLGESKNGRKCRIQNPKVIHFISRGIMGGNNWELEAMLDSSLQLENRMLGYLVSYKMEYFRFSNNDVSYFGYPLLTDRLDSMKKTSKIIKNRRETYKGSKLHFFRSLHTNTLDEEGFEVYKIAQFPIDSADREDYGLLQDSVFIGKANTRMEQTTERIQLYEYVKPQLLTGTPILTIKEPFEICYINKKEESYYVAKTKYYDGLRRRYKGQSTIVKLKNGEIKFYANGSTENIYELVTIGYWSYLKMGDFLPFDYVFEEEDEKD